MNISVPPLFDLGSAKDELAFTSHIREYHVVEKHLLYKDLAEHCFSDFHRNQSSVYLIVKTRQPRFIPGSFFISHDFCIQGEIVVGQHREHVVFNIAKLLHSSRGTTKHPHWDAWADKVMSLWKIESAPTASASQKYRALSNIDLTLSDQDYLYINCALMRGVRGGNPDVRAVVTPAQLGQMFDWDIFENLEVLYVGKSCDSVLKRTHDHNKWGNITNDLGADEVALIYFMDIEQSSYAKLTQGALIQIGKVADPALDRDAIAVITEAALIKHFFDEKKYNKQVVEQDFQEILKVKEKLRVRGYTALQVSLMLDGVMGCLGTQKTGFHNLHTFSYLLNTL